MNSMTEAPRRPGSAPARTTPDPLGTAARRPARSTPQDLAAARTHLTRRGRVIAVLLLAVILLAAFSLGRVASQAAPTVGGASTPTYEQTTVQPGESLWALARRAAPDNDPREVIAQIRRINGLESSQLRAGQQLLLPVAA